MKKLTAIFLLSVSINANAYDYSNIKPEHENNHKYLVPPVNGDDSLKGSIQWYASGEKPPKPPRPPEVPIPSTVWLFLGGLLAFLKIKKL